MPRAKVITPSEAARMLRVRHHVVLQWIHQGELVATNVAVKSKGRPRFRIDEDDLTEFLRSRQPQQEPRKPRARSSLALNRKGKTQWL